MNDMCCNTKLFQCYIHQIAVNRNFCVGLSFAKNGKTRNSFVHLPAATRIRRLHLTVSPNDRNHHIVQDG